MTGTGSDCGRDFDVPNRWIVSVAEILRQDRKQLNGLHNVPAFGIFAGGISGSDVGREQKE